MLAHLELISAFPIGEAGYTVPDLAEAIRNDFKRLAKCLEHTIIRQLPCNTCIPACSSGEPSR